MSESERDAADNLSPVLTEATRIRLEGVRRGLLHLHKALLDSERAAYEQTNERRVTPGELLQLLIHDRWFAWLRPFSEMVVVIDELQEAGKKSPGLLTERDVLDVLGQARLLLEMTESGTGSGERYFAALQNDPATILAYSEVLRYFPETNVG